MESYDGVKHVDINTHGVELWFTRHAQSMQNIGHSIPDSPLSDEGRQQAAKLTGKFDVVVCSVMRRCQETLHYSTITYDRLIIEPLFREEMGAGGNELLNEKQLPWEREPYEHMFIRAQQFTFMLEQVLKSVSESESTTKRVLLVGHACFFNTWYLQGCFKSPHNARIYGLL
jgi:broad specificity phosphatase PhoE